MQNNHKLEYDISMKRSNGVLRYFVVGERSFEASINLWKKIYQDCETHNISNIHATILLSGVLNRMEIPEIVQKLIELNSNREINCAWVDLNHASYLDNIIGMKMPRPKCMNIRVFDNEEDAERWIQQQVDESVENT